MFRPIGSFRWMFLSCIAIFACMICVNPVGAAPSSLMASGFGRYWEGFKEYWISFIRRQDGVMLVALVVGAVSIFILTRGKWKK